MDGWMYIEFHKFRGFMFILLQRMIYLKREEWLYKILLTQNQNLDSFCWTHCKTLKKDLNVKALVKSRVWGDGWRDVTPHLKSNESLNRCSVSHRTVMAATCTWRERGDLLRRHTCELWREVSARVLLHALPQHDSDIRERQISPQEEEEE